MQSAAECHRIYELGRLGRHRENIPRQQLAPVMRALLVDDSPSMRKVVAAMLTSLGYDHIVEAADGGEAWEKLSESDLDLLATNWNMPVLSGLELVEKVREQPHFHDLPILMFTSRAEKADVIEALKAGVDSYITKPFSPQQLREKLRSLSGNREGRQIEHVVRGSVFLSRDVSCPLVIFGEEANTLSRLTSPDLHEVADYLIDAVSTLALINAENADLNAGYVVEASTSSIARDLKTHGSLIKLLLVSSRIPGGGITMARLVSINRVSDFTIFLICEHQEEIDDQTRLGLDRIGIAVVERSRMQRKGLEQVFNEYLVTTGDEEAPSELPAPEEIRSRVERDIKSMVTLPVLPQVYHQIIALDRDSDSDLSDWSGAIDVDPLSRAQVIRRARSPIYGFRGEIDETERAVVLLGKNSVKEIIVAGAVKKSFEGIKEEGFLVDEYWEHSVAVALLARILVFPLNQMDWTPEDKKEFEDLDLSQEVVEALKGAGLAERLTLSDNQDPFIGGMMHDIGKAALAHSYPGLFSLVLAELTRKNWNVPIYVAEDAVAGGAHHMLVGGIIGNSWQLGNELCDLIERHHNPAPGDDFGKLIAFANVLAGGIAPFPKLASYPMARLLQGDVAVTDATESGEEEGEGETDPAKTEPEEVDGPEESASQEDGADTENAENEAIAQMSPPEAMRRFLPEGLLEQLELDLAQTVELGKVLAPVVQRLTGDLKHAD